MAPSRRLVTDLQTFQMTRTELEAIRRVTDYASAAVFGAILIMKPRPQRLSIC